MSKLTEKERYELEKSANRIRKHIIRMLTEARSGHTAGSLGMADVLAVLYLKVLNHRPEEPFWEGRDRVVLSNGHICPALYATMAEAGYFPEDELITLRKLGSRLQGHPHREHLPGVETTSGPLGCGLSQIAGMAIADRMGGGHPSERHFYCLLSDGELNSGNIWEAGMLIAKEKLADITAIVDRNNIQIDGFTQDVMPLEPLKEKWEAWGWSTVEVDGHDVDRIAKAFMDAKSDKERPVVIIAKTVPGKGVAEFENKYEWHGKVPDEEQERKALEELSKTDDEIELRYKGKI